VNKLSVVHKIITSLKFMAFQKLTHGELIKELLSSNPKFSGKAAIYVETGCGISTLALAEMGKANNAAVYSCDINSEKAHELESLSGGLVSNVNFLIGNSLDNLYEIAAKHKVIDFLFLDSAASAMHTFKEFQVVEQYLKPGSCVLIDNAAIPGEKHVLTPVRKGKILVPYLLASPFWEVTGHPEAGDSMVSAVMHSEADYADDAYEDPDYIDNWKNLFGKTLDR
jgi:predicted O-methyltransferase YrrM